MSAPYMPLFVADYLADTAHLSAAEHGAYLLLIMNYWQRCKPLPNDDRKLARIARMTDDEWAVSKDNIAEFFQVSGDEWRHSRIENEISIVSEKSAKAKASARASVEARATNAERTLNERSTNAELLGKDRIGKNSISSLRSDSADAPQPNLDLNSEIQTKPEPIAKPKTTKPTKPVKTALDPRASPTADDRTYAANLGMTEATLANEWEKFKLNHLSRQTRAVSWAMMWQTWVRNWVTYGSRNVEMRPYGGGKPPIMNVVPAINREASAEATGKVWIKADTPEWGRAVQRLGRKPPNVGGGWYFDKDILDGLAVSH